MCGSVPAPVLATYNTTSVNVEFPTAALRELTRGQMFKRAKSTGDTAIYMAYSYGGTLALNLETGQKNYGIREEQVYPLPTGSLVTIVQG